MLNVSGEAEKIEGMGLRLFNPETKQLSLNWASRRNGTMTSPMLGHCDVKGGEFFDGELLDGRPLFARNGFTRSRRTRRGLNRHSRRTQARRGRRNG